MSDTNADKKLIRYDAILTKETLEEIYGDNMGIIVYSFRTIAEAIEWARTDKIYRFVRITIEEIELEVPEIPDAPTI